MGLPHDFTEMLEKVEQFGILDEEPEQIRNRAVLALQGVGAVVGGQTVDLGVVDWSTKLLRKLETAIYKEICDPQKGALKEAYQNLLDKALTTEGIEAVASVVLKIVATINPAFVVSSVGIYIAVWLLKIGLNFWCSQPITPQS